MRLLCLALLLLFGACGATPVATLPVVGVPESAGSAPNAALLASPASLAEKVALAGDEGAADVVIVDARPRADYDRAHIPGAISAPWDELTDAEGLPRPDGVIAELFGLAGASDTHHLVIYDEGAADPAAERLFWLLEHMGATQLQVLAGGLSAWSGERTDVLPRRPPATFAVRRREALAADDARLQAAIAGGEVVVDARDDAEYIGWALRDLPRGGHVHGARHFPARWTRTADGPRGQLSALARKKLPRDRSLILYSTRGGRAAQLYFGLRLCDYPQLAIYPGGLARWTSNRRRELVSLPNHSTLVHPAWLRAVIDGETPPNPPRGSRTVIVEVSWGAAKNVYDKGHIPGAIHLDTDKIEADEKLEPRNWWNLRPDAQLAAALAAHGITRDATVVVYSHTHLASARVFWALMLAGVEDVRLLNGGWRAWTDAGMPTSTDASAPTAAASFGGSVPGRASLRKTSSEVRGALEGGIPVVAIRSWAEHIGNTSGYDYIPTKGRIKGSIWGHGGPNANSVADFEDDDGTLRSYTEIRAMWKKDGFGADEPAIFYCGTGWRASVAFALAHAMGWKASVYDGGWMEWSMGPEHENRPKATGIPRR